jgi:predicted molibdopterin-dependent oxidoreductase YjgC
VLTDRGHGQVRGVWLGRYDPVSTAFFGDAAHSLRECDLLVVQHLFLTETARLAHVVLPTAAFGEEQVTFTSTERRIQLAERVLAPPPEVLAAWRQLALVGQAMGANWSFDSAAEVMEEIGRVVPFYQGASYENLERDYGRQWPCTSDRPLGTRFLFGEDLPANRFRFVPVARPRLEAMEIEDYPLALVFGHSLYYWHQNVLIRHSETLKREYRILLLDYPNGFVEINADDAKRLGIRDGETIRLRAPSGSASVAARVTPEVRSGTVFVPYFVQEVQRQIRGSLENGFRAVPVRVEKEVG